VATIAQDGTAVFEDVAPGDYEILSMTEPYAVSWCLRVDGASEVLRVECPQPWRGSRIEGRVEGPSGTHCDVQVRTLGRVFDVSRPVTCPGEYEFADLPGGLYSVRAVTSGAFRSGRPDDSSGVTPWRNVVVEPGGRVTVDFRVE
jgi:hypothetical protein